MASGDPLIFEMHNEAVGKKLFAGVLEFSGEEHNCVYVPGHIMHNLGARVWCERGASNLAEASRVPAPQPPRTAARSPSSCAPSPE